MMPSEKENGKTVPTGTADPSQKLGEADMISLKDGVPSKSSISSSGNATSGIKGETDQESIEEQGCAHLDIKANGSDQQSVLCASEALPRNSWVSSSDDVQNGTTDNSSTTKCGPKSLTLENMNDLKSTDKNGNLTSKSPQYMPDTKKEKKIIKKVPHLQFNFSVVGLPRVYNPMGKSSLTSQKRPVFPPTDYQPIGRTQSVNDRPISRDKLNWNPELDKSPELTHGPSLVSQKQHVYPPTDCGPTGRAQSVSDRPISRDNLNWNTRLEKSPELTGGPSLANQKHVFPPTDCQPTGRAESVNDRPLSRDKLNWNPGLEKSPELTHGPPLASQSQHVFTPTDCQPTRRELSVNDRTMSRDKLSWNTELEMSPELTRGPRCYDRNSQSESSTVKQTFGFSISRDKYNLSDFQTEYEDAKFYVIKSFNEDDIHKSIKYNVWTSTRYGNKKLNAAFQDAENKSSETGTKCPVFLFFSVNGSGQFVGVAEMIGLVDFNKDMNFWKVEKYNGFFPIKWHILKDVPNTQFRYIILPNNDNRRVTYSRDTQEVGLKQGMEMLNIFKRYLAKTSLLDDYDFYANREKLFRAQSSTKHTTLQREAYIIDNY